MKILISTIPIILLFTLTTCVWERSDNEKQQKVLFDYLSRVDAMELEMEAEVELVYLAEPLVSDGDQQLLASTDEVLESLHKYFVAILPIISGFLSEMEAIEPPMIAIEAHASFVDAVAASVENITKAVAALDDGDYQAFESLTTEFENAEKTMEIASAKWEELLDAYD